MINEGRNFVLCINDYKKIAASVFKISISLLFLAISGTAKSVPYEWDNVYEPPVLDNPMTFTSIEELPLTTIGSWGIVCAGYIYRVSGGDRDVLVDLSGSRPLKYPLFVDTTKNAIVRGVSIDLSVQEGCDVNELPNNPTELHPNSNIIPRPPTGRVIGLTVKRVAWLEGIHIDANWQNADCIVWSSPNSEIESYRENSSFYLINSRCEHYDGHGISEIGDALHADLFQNQVGAPRHLYFENVVAVSGNQGIVNLNGTKSKRLEARNFSYIKDVLNQVGPDSTGPMVSTDVPVNGLLFENVWKGPGGPAVWGPHNGSWPKNWRFDPHNATHAGIPGHPEITSGEAPDFAPIKYVGTNYSSPFALKGVSPKEPVVEQPAVEPMTVPKDLGIELLPSLDKIGTEQ